MKDSQNVIEPGGSEQPVTHRKSKSKTPALDHFGRDLTVMGKEKKLDPLVGMGDKLERMAQILCRRQKNNPILIGEAGVGKTALAEGLAQAIADETAPYQILNKRVIMLDMTLLVAGAIYRGQFEERLKAIIDEIRKEKNIILFIDEIHTVVGCGNPSGGMDAANILKPALSRGEIQCIGATTINEYRKYIEKDSALERRFQPIMVVEPTVEEAVCILKGLKGRYEEYHGVEYTDDAIEAAARLTNQYVTGRFLPDKAIDALDESGAKAKIGASTRPGSLRQIEEEIEKIRTEKIAKTKDQRFEEAAKLRDFEAAKSDELAKAVEQWKQSKINDRIKVTAESVAAVVSLTTGIPLQKVCEEETSRLLKMEDEIRRTVIGQDAAAKVISTALRRSKSGLKNPARPIGSFLFLGQTGTGKTLTARALAEFMFGSQDALIQIDMSEYMERHSTSRMIGAPPGYIGHEEGGQLTERVRRRPYSVILFDEAEKAHPDVLTLLLQILEEGKLTDSIGRTVSFRNCIIILTSNLGFDAPKKSKGIGFSTGDSADDSAKAKDAIISKAKQVFRPEIINRFDDIVVFEALDKNDMDKILALELDKVSKRLVSKGIIMKLSQSARDLLKEVGFNPSMGARPLRRAVQVHIEDLLAGAMLDGKLQEGDCALFSASDDKMYIKVTKGRTNLAVHIEKA